MKPTRPENPKDAIGITKLPLHLISPIVEAYQAIAHYLGNVKYGAWNYRGAGIRYSVYYAACKRHLGAWWEGEEYDPVDGTPHLGNALACINILIEGKHAGNAIDDRPPSQAKELAKIRAELEALMGKILERYSDKDPYHYTIRDNIVRDQDPGAVEARGPNPIHPWLTDGGAAYRRNDGPSGAGTSEPGQPIPGGNPTWATPGSGEPPQRFPFLERGVWEGQPTGSD